MKEMVDSVLPGLSKILGDFGERLKVARLRRRYSAEMVAQRAGLLGIVTRGLKDAKVEAISDDLRFQAAFSSALTAANITLRASGSRQNTIWSSPEDCRIVGVDDSSGCKADPYVARLSKKRNATSYDAAGSVSQQDLELAIQVAEALERRAIAWMKQHHPELL